MPASGGSGFGSSVSIPFGGGTVTNVPVYVRFVPGTTGALGGDVTNASTGAATQNVAVTGTGLPVANLAITKTDGVTTATPGGPCDHDAA